MLLSLSIAINEQITIFIIFYYKINRKIWVGPDENKTHALCVRFDHYVYLHWPIV